jgi:bacteriocin biosynthesis cyclodehydratase domain-containing protein
MMETRGAPWPDANTQVKLAERIQVSKLDENEYEFVSLTGSVRVKCELGNGVFVPDIVRRLKTGVSANELAAHQGNGGSVQRLMRFLQELASCGVLTHVPTPANELPPEERQQYFEQAKFFGNFPLHSQPPPGAAEGAGMTDGAWEVQARLRESRVLLDGLGRIGSKVACMLAQLGIGHIHAADDQPVAPADVIDSAFRRSNIGLPRRETLQSVIGELNPLVEFLPHPSDPSRPGIQFEVPDDIHLLIVCRDQFDPDYYLEINRACLARKTRWVSMRNLGRRIEIGPLIVPFETACFRCLEIRKLMNLSYYGDYLTTQRKLAANRLTLGMPNITVGCDFLALEAIKALTHFNHPVSFGSVLTLDLVTMESHVHPVLRLPRCPDCGRTANDRPSTSIWNSDDLFKSL